MIGLLALRALVRRPWRTLLLLGGFGLGVGVMIVLLGIGHALVTQARDERLVGGGDITVLPEGMNIEVMKTGGVGGMFFSIANAWFVDHQMLDAPRLAPLVRAVAPQIAPKLAYLRTPRAVYPVHASGSIPSRDAAVGAAPRVVAGRWVDDSADRAWIEPTAREAYATMDRFHRPPPDIAHPESWAEWHYFNVLSADARRWAFITLAVRGAPAPGSPYAPWGAVSITLRTLGASTRRFSARIAPRDVELSEASPDLRLGPSRVTLLDDGRYHVQATGRDAAGARVTVDLVVTPAPHAWFPGTVLAGGPLLSGYAAPGIRASASGRICVGGACERFDGAQAYHDHNWGVWRDVRWEWGAARAGSFAVLYGRVLGAAAAEPPLFLYLVDSLGFRALFRPRRITYAGERAITVAGRRVLVPAAAVMADARGDDTLRVTIRFRDAIGTDIRTAGAGLAPGGSASTPYFIQLEGDLSLDGRVGGRTIAGAGRGFFETFR